MSGPRRGANGMGPDQLRAAAGQRRRRRPRAASLRRFPRRDRTRGDLPGAGDPPAHRGLQAVARPPARAEHLHRLQRHPSFPQPGQAGMAQLMAGRVPQPRPAPRGSQDLVGPLSRQRLPAARSLEHQENPVAASTRRPLGVQVGIPRTRFDEIGQQGTVLEAGIRGPESALHNQLAEGVSGRAWHAV